MLDFWWDKRYLVPLYGGCQPERDFPRLAHWALEGRLDLRGMVTRRYALDALPQAMEGAAPRSTGCSTATSDTTAHTTVPRMARLDDHPRIV